MKYIVYTLALCTQISTCLYATSYTWSGGGADTNMNTALNWNSSSIPANSTSSTITFPTSATQYTVNNNIATGFQFGSLTFGNHAYTVTGNSFAVPAAFGSGITFGTSGTAIQTTMTLSASSSALSITNNSSGYNTIGNSSGGGLSGNGVLNLLKGKTNIGGTGTFNGTINITGASGGVTTILQAGAAGSVGNTAYPPLSVNLTEPGGTSYDAKFDLNGYAQTIQGLTGSTGTTVDIAGSTLTMTTAGSYQTPFFGTLSGASGNLVLTSGANLALMGTSSYTGTTTLQSGASLFTTTLGSTSSYTIGGGGGTLQLQLGSSATTSKNITMNDQTTIALNGGNLTHTGTLSGSGTFIKLGPGKLTLAGTATNTGAVQIQGGTLNVNSSTVPSGAIVFEGYAGTLQAGSNLTLSQAVTMSVPGTIDTNGYTISMAGPVSGGNKFVKKGSGTLTFQSAGNNYTGKTVILGGTLNATSSTLPMGSSGSPQLVFQGEGTFQAGSAFTNFQPAIIMMQPGSFDTNSYSVVANGLITGSGTFTKAGTGTLTFGNTGNNYTGDVLISNGTLNGTSSTISTDMPSLIFGGSGSGIFQAGSDFTGMPSNIILQNNGTIDTQSYNVVIDGNVVGEPTYTLTKTGSGTLVINGQSYFSGTMTASQGHLYLNGISSNNITVSSGGIFRGTPVSSGAITIANGASIRPGNSVGHMTLGSLTLNPGSTTIIEINGTEGSSITVTGAAAVDGAVQVIPDTDAYPRSGQYLLLSAGSRSGTFASISSSPGFAFSLSYLSNDIYLNFAQSIPTTALTGKILQFADYLNSYAPGSAEFSALAALTGSTLSNAVNMVSPARNAYGPFVAAETLMTIDQMIYNRLSTKRFIRSLSSNQVDIASYLVDASNQVAPNAKKEAPFEVWFDGFWQTAKETGQAQNPNFHFNSAGGMVGLDYNNLPNTVLGGGLGFAYSHNIDNQNFGSATIEYYFASLAATTQLGEFYIEPALLGVYNPIKNKRTIIIPGYDYTAEATINDWQLNTHIGFGYDRNYSWGGIEPFTAIDWAVNWQGAFTEANAGAFNMHQDSHTSSFLQSQAGIRFYQIAKCFFGSIGFKESASYINRLPFGTGDVTATITGANQSITLTSLSGVQNLGAVNFEMFTRMGKDQSFLLSLDYQGEFCPSYMSNEIFLNFSKSF